MKFYPTDWRGDQTLRAVSLAARGLWIEMLMIMHEADPYGHLVLGARPVSNDILARMVSAQPIEIEQLLAELENAGVYNRTGRGGVIYSRRMTKDRLKANKCRKAAKTRWAQPTGSTQEKLRPNRSTNGSPHGSFEHDPSPRSQTEVDNLLSVPEKERSLRDLEKKASEEAIAAWNELASRFSLPRMVKLTGTRKRQLAARLNAEGLDGWRAMLAKVAASAFLRGDSKTGWRVDFDFVLKEANFVKITEGRYDTGPPSEPVRYERDPLGNMRRVG
jgi:hypothetical protein